MHFPSLKIVAWARGGQRERQLELEENKREGGRESEEREGGGRKVRGSVLASFSWLIRDANNIPPASTSRRWVCFI